MSAALLLLSDSQLLFRASAKMELRQKIQHCLGFSHSSLPRQLPVRIAYVGAANNNEPVYFELARDAFEELVPAATEFVFIREEQELPGEPCQIVILAGGSVSQGWDFINREKVRRWLQQCHQQQDNLFVGVSAGAIHLAAGCDPEQELVEPALQHFLDWFPYRIAVHEEAINWPSLKVFMLRFPGCPALGIPMGAGVWAEHGMWTKLESGCAIVRLDQEGITFEGGPGYKGE